MHIHFLVNFDKTFRNLKHCQDVSVASVELCIGSAEAEICMMHFFRNLFWQVNTFIHIAHPFSRTSRWNFKAIQQLSRRIRSKCRVVHWFSGRWDMTFIVLFNRNFSVSHKFSYLAYLKVFFRRTSSIWFWVHVASLAKQIISIGWVQQELCVTLGSDDFVLLFLLASTFRSFSTFDELYI